MLHRTIRVTSAKNNLCSICAKLVAYYALRLAKQTTNPNPNAPYFRVSHTLHFYFAQMLHRKKTQMLLRTIRVTSAKNNLCNICAKYVAYYEITNIESPKTAALPLSVCSPCAPSTPPGIALQSLFSL